MLEEFTKRDQGIPAPENFRVYFGPKVSIILFSPQLLFYIYTSLYPLANKLSPLNPCNTLNFLMEQSFVSFV